MKLIAAACAAVVAAGCASAQAPDEAPSLGWLSGCWISDDGSSREVWSEPYGGLLFGYSVALRNGAPVFFEDLRIEPTEAGADYVASPAGGDPVRFARAEAGTSSVAFENPEHDFPQRIAYAREGDRLTATISLVDGSQPRSFAWNPCPE